MVGSWPYPIWLDRKTSARNKPSSLLGSFINYYQNKVLWIRPGSLLKKPGDSYSPGIWPLDLPRGNTLAYLVRVIESEKSFTRLKENLNVGTFSIHVQLKYHFSDQISHLDLTYKTLFCNGTAGFYIVIVYRVFSAKFLQLIMLL